MNAKLITCSSAVVFFISPSGTGACKKQDVSKDGGSSVPLVSLVACIF